jgi:hypothetical protein
MVNGKGCGNMRCYCYNISIRSIQCKATCNVTTQFSVTYCLPTENTQIYQIDSVILSICKGATAVKVTYNISVEFAGEITVLAPNLF